MKTKAAIASLSLAIAAAAACSSSNPTRPFLSGVGAFGGAGTSGGGGASGSGVPGQTVVTFPQTINRNVDVLFMVDNSLPMVVEQKKLVESFSAYTDVLKLLPGGLPNLHLAVVSSSMGAGSELNIQGCPRGGDQGIFQSAKRGDAATCTAGSLNAGQNFIINLNGTTNYTGELSDVFSCIAPLGDQGCGFEHQLESILRALGADGAPPPTQNNGFLRPDAYLQIVVLSNEDDCSAPPDSNLFSMTSRLVSDPLGPLQSYRCNEFGHLCGGHPPPRTMAADLSGTCVSAEDGRLLRVRDVVAAIKNLKRDPANVMVAAIAAPPNPYIVGLAPPEIKTDPSPWPYVQRSCMASDGSSGLPAVRLAQWVDAFGSNGVFEQICQDSFAPALQRIAGQIGKAMGPPCLDAKLDPGKCTFVDNNVNGDGTLTASPLPRCAGPSSQAPCWDVETDPVTCPSGARVVFNRSASSQPPESSTATCAP
jgi:hypothetical protein